MRERVQQHLGAGTPPYSMRREVAAECPCARHGVEEAEHVARHGMEPRAKRELLLKFRVTSEGLVCEPWWIEGARSRSRALASTAKTNGTGATKSVLDFSAGVTLPIKVTGGLTCPTGATTALFKAKYAITNNTDAAQQITVAAAAVAPTEEPTVPPTADPTETAAG